ncbi:MAG: type IV pilus assembly protein PilM [Patescibacteria group bacterium]
MSFFSSLFGKKETSVIGIDIGSSSIKIVQLSRKGGKAVLDTYGELALGPYGNVEIGRATNLPPEKISEALNDVIRESKMTSKSSGIAIPFGASLISLIEMPAVSDQQLAQMVPIEARKYIPVPITEVMLDWILVPRQVDKELKFNEEAPHSPNQPTEKIDVLIVAIHNETLARYQSIVTASALQTSFFEIEIFSTIRSVLDQDTTTQMIVDLGAATTKVYIVERGIIRASHVISRGAQDITLGLARTLNIPVQEAEIIKRDLSRVDSDKKKAVDDVVNLTLDYIFSEAQRVLLSYQKKFNKDISKVVMVGGGARLQNVLKRAESNFQTSVVLGDPFGKTEAPAFLEEVLKHTGPEFAVALGVALRKLQELS